MLKLCTRISHQFEEPPKPMVVHRELACYQELALARTVMTSLLGLNCISRWVLGQLFLRTGSRVTCTIFCFLFSHLLHLSAEDQSCFGLSVIQQNSLRCIRCYFIHRRVMSTEAILFSHVAVDLQNAPLQTD